MLELKNKKWILLALFLLSVAAGVSYPVIKIIRYDFGTRPAVYRFEAGIVDPYDPFRGRYVTLSPLPTEVILEEDKDFDDYENVYAVLANDGRGIAQVVDLIEKPESGKDAVLVPYYWPRVIQDPTDEEAGKYSYRIRLPFTRFYMNEKLAPAAERAVDEALRRNDGTCTIVVNIYKDGNYAIKDLEINGTPIRQYIEEHKETD